MLWSVLLHGFGEKAPTSRVNQEASCASELYGSSFSCEFLHSAAQSCSWVCPPSQSRLFEQTVPRKPTVSHLFVRPPQLLATIPQSSQPSSPLHAPAETSSKNCSCYDNFRKAFVEFFRGVIRSWIMLFTKLGSWCPLCIFSHDANLLSLFDPEAAWYVLASCLPIPDSRAFR